jgi:hypothetical protein
MLFCRILVCLMYKIISPFRFLFLVKERVNFEGVRFDGVTAIQVF